MTRCRSSKYRLYPTAKQTQRLESLMKLQCELYNAALEERRGAWAWEHRSVGYIDQCRSLTELREVRPEVLEAGVVVCRGTLKRLDRAFSSFYKRCQKGEKPGYPRFKAARRFDSLQWEDTSGWKIEEGLRRLKLLGIGSVKLNLHRPLRGTSKAITVRREGRHWYVSVRCVEVPAEMLPETGREVGIDLGVEVLVATSDGEFVSANRPMKRSADRLAEAQQRLHQKKRGSNRRKRAVAEVARLHRKVARQRHDALHKVSRQLVDDYDVIVHERLAPAQMSRRPRPKKGEDGGFLPNGASAKAGLNRSILDSGWGTLTSMIAYKAEEAGRQIIEVDPRNTSRRCNACGSVAESNRKGRVFSCVECGHGDHADVNAARNILGAGRALRQPAAA